MKALVCQPWPPCALFSQLEGLVQIEHARSRRPREKASRDRRNSETSVETQVDWSWPLHELDTGKEHPALGRNSEWKTKK